MRKALAVHFDADMLDLMASALKEKFPDLITERVRNAADAMDQCRAQTGDPFRVVIAYDSIAPDFRTPRNESEDKGMEFLESLERVGHGDVPKILIAPTAGNSLLLRVARLRNGSLMLNEHSDSFEASFVDIVTRALEHPPDDFQDQEKEIKVVFSLNLEKECWEYELKGVGFDYKMMKPLALQVDSLMFRRLVNRSRRAGENLNDWEQNLLEIGQDLGGLLLYGNPGFLTELLNAQAEAGGAGRKSICFSIEKSVHQAALEALTDPKEENFWMLQVPMYRRLIRSGQGALQRPVLFRERRRRPESFSALIIESPAEGVVETLTDKKGRPLQLDPLENVTPEAAAVEQILGKRASRLKRIGPKDIPVGRKFKDYLQEVLRAEPWDLVHYAGHSHYDETTGKGHLFFPGEFVEELDMEIFNTYLDHAKTRFIYLGGCKSSEAGFVFELARLQIPGVLGFRWPINDRVALEFAKKFYESLFETIAPPCLEKAFLSTRCAIRKTHKEDKIWAAAMLILQDTD